MKRLGLTDLISVEALQQIQDGFSKYTGMAALTTDSDGVPVTNGSGFTRFCMELNRKSEKGCRNCEECDKNGALLTLKNGHASVYSCHAGLMDYAAPIMVDGMFLGSFIGGQVRYEDVDEEKMAKTATEYGIDPDEYVSAAKETTILSKDRIQKAAVFLEEMAAGISGMAYRNYLALQESRRMEGVAKSQADFVMNMSMNLEHTMMNWFDIIDNTIKNINDQKVKEMLLKMQDEGMDMQESIKETIEYIRMSANKVELKEAEYDVSELAKQIRDGALRHANENNFISELTLSESVPEKLFGDAGRIGQIVNRVIREMLENKTAGTINVNLSAKNISYATMLYITITDFKTGFTKKELDDIRETFAKNRYQDEFVTDVSGFAFAFVRLLLRKMSGTIKVYERGEETFFEICLPQLKLGGDR